MMIRNHNFAKFIRRSLSSTAQPIIVNNNNTVQETKLQQLINTDLKDNNPVPVFKKAILNSSKIAVKDLNGEKLYSDLILGSFKLSKQINDVCGELKHMIQIVSLSKNNSQKYFPLFSRIYLHSERITIESGISLSK